MFSTLAIAAHLLILQTAQASFFDDQEEGLIFDQPPSIYQGPQPSVRIYRQDENVDLLCVASGHPPPTYEWLKDGNRLDTASLPRRYKFITHGTLRILRATSLDEGFYQCSASNQLGTALSSVIQLRRAVLDYYRSSAVREYRIPEGEKLQMECNAPRSVPNATYSWSIARDVDTNPHLLRDTGRMQISSNGDVHFSYVKYSDANDGGFMYKCNVFNPFLDLTTTGSYSVVHVIPNNEIGGGIPSSRPFIYFSSPAVVVAVEGRTATLRCFFSGHPEPRVTWRQDGRHIKPTTTRYRYRYDNFHTELIIDDVESSDESTFTCHGTNDVDTTTQTILLDVQAAPEFRETEDGPHNINVTAGHSVSIHCRTHAEPPAHVTWYQNGHLLNPDFLPRNCRLSADRATLTLRKMCKRSLDDLDCSLETDSGPTVIQCNASNEHGYVFANGYVNVLEPTVITERPVDTELVPYADVMFPCVAKTDASTPLTRKWYYDSEPVANNDVMFVASNGSLVVRLSLVDHGGTHLTGTYQCHVTNGYSTATAYARLYVLGAKPVTVAARPLSRRLLIGVIVAFFLLILVLLLLLCFIQRNRTGTYRVDEKERKHGNDPEKDLDNQRFLEYMKSGSEPSLQSTTHVPAETVDDDAAPSSSDSENGTFIEEGRYNEDGSFIGQYSAPDKYIGAQNGRYYS